MMTLTSDAITLCRRIFCIARRRKLPTNYADLSEEEIEAAMERGRIAAATEPHAIAVRYDAQSDRVFVGLRDGSSFGFSPRGILGLESVSCEDLASVEIIGRGGGLRWEALDVHVSVPGLAAENTSPRTKI
jgi:hypothetical protein